MPVTVAVTGHRRAGRGGTRDGGLQGPQLVRSRPGPWLAAVADVVEQLRRRREGSRVRRQHTSGTGRELVRRPPGIGDQHAAFFQPGRDGPQVLEDRGRVVAGRGVALSPVPVPAGGQLGVSGQQPGPGAPRAGDRADSAKDDGHDQHHQGGQRDQRPPAAREIGTSARQPVEQAFGWLSSHCRKDWCG
jgi:hypothetical protein